MGSRVRSVIIALVLSLLATGAAMAYINSARGAVEEGGKTRAIMVAAREVPAGTPASALEVENMVEKREVPNRYIAEGAVTDLTDSGDKVVTADLKPGEQLTSSRLAGKDDADLRVKIPAGHMAVSVPIDEATGVSGKLKTGDKVGVLATVEVAGSGSETTKLLLSNIEVLRVSSEDDPAKGQGPGSSQQKKTVTLSVTTAEAEKLVFALREGDIWLGLQPTTGEFGATAAGQTAATVFK